MLAFGDTTGQLSSKTRYWVEKTPFNERFTQRIFSWWPDALCIHIVRDPRDNFVSYSRKQQTWSPEYFSSFWSKSIQTGLINQKRYTQMHYWMLSYERLVDKPEKFIAELCEFLEIEEHPTLRIPTRNGIPWKGNSMFGDVFEQISTTPVGRWKSELSPSVIALIEAMSGKLMPKFNYIPYSGLNVIAIFRAYLWKTKLNLYRTIWANRKGSQFWNLSNDEELSDKQSLH